jgi:serine protease AprX
MRPIFRFTVILLVALLISGSSPIPPASATPWQDKVDHWVLQSALAAENGQTDFLIYLADQADLSRAAFLITKEEKGAFVYQALTETARRTQASLLAELQRQDIPHRAYWIANMIWARGDVQLVQSLAQRRDVGRIHANPQMYSAQAERAVSEGGVTGITLNIDQVGAPLVWAAGYTGQGVVVGGQDTGYEWDHPALINQYRGWNGTEADHTVSWHDAIHEDSGFSGMNLCEFDSPFPCDDDGHGTHTMGTILGDDGLGNQIGVAPGARWIGCRNMWFGVGTPATYSECYEWFIAPYPSGTSSFEGDPGLAPDIINNSWACLESEGCNKLDILLSVVDAVRAAGILTVHSAGNSGPACGTVNTPAAIYDSSFTVGNVTSKDIIATNSSRGPVLVDGSGRLKPDISAPGTSIYSSYLNGSYTTLSGTSMAAPHVAGVAALLLSAQPLLSGQVDQLEQVMTSTAYALTSDQECGGVPGDSIPNNTYGYGRIDAYKSLNLLEHGFEISVTTSSHYVSPGQLIHIEVIVTHTHLIYPTENVSVTGQFEPEITPVFSNEPYTQLGDGILWQFASLAPNESLLITVDLRVPDTYPLGTIIESTFSVSSDQVEIPVSSSSPPIAVLYAIHFPLISIVE